MRYFLSSLLILFLSLSLIGNEAFAKRFGGGRSFGVQRSNSALYSQPYKAPSSALKPNAPGSRWGGLIGGLLIGGLLGSLFMGNGLASGILSWLILGGLILLLVALFRRRMPGMQFTGGPAPQANNYNPFQFAQGGTAPENPTADAEYPADFNPELFLREAKVCFIRMQAAYDQKNLQDLTAFTAPEVFGEIKMQLDERGDEPNHTEVVHLDAELLNVEKQFDSTIASVRFSGTIKENEEPAVEFSEIWHFRQFGTSKDWVVGGIQQL